MNQRTEDIEYPNVRTYYDGRHAAQGIEAVDLNRCRGRCACGWTSRVGRGASAVAHDVRAHIVAENTREATEARIRAEVEALPSWVDNADVLRRHDVLAVIGGEQGEATARGAYVPTPDEQRIIDWMLRNGEARKVDAQQHANRGAYATAVVNFERAYGAQEAAHQIEAGLHHPGAYDA